MSWDQSEAGSGKWAEAGTSGGCARVRKGAGDRIPEPRAWGALAEVWERGAGPTTVLGRLEVLKEEARNPANKVDAPYAPRISKSSAHSSEYICLVLAKVFISLDCKILSVHLGAKGKAFLLKTGFCACLPSSPPARETKRQGRLKKNSKKRAFLENNPFLADNGLS